MENRIRRQNPADVFAGFVERDVFDPHARVDDGRLWQPTVDAMRTGIVGGRSQHVIAVITGGHAAEV